MNRVWWESRPSCTYRPHEAGYERYVAAAVFADLTGTPATNQDYYGPG
jgi:hypothetical protein